MKNKLKPNEKDKVMEDFKSGKMDGKGTIAQPDGDTLTGDFKADLPIKGEIKSKDGSVKKEYDAAKEATKAIGN